MTKFLIKYGTMNRLIDYPNKQHGGLLTSTMRSRSVVRACTLWKLAMRKMGRKPSWSIFLRRKKSRSKLSRLK